MTNLNDITFDKGCDLYLAFKENNIKKSTYYNYKYTIEKYFRKDLGNKTLSDLLEFDFNSYIKSKKDSLENDKQNVNDLIIRLKSILRFLRKRFKDFRIELDLISTSKNEIAEIDVFSDKERNRLSNYLLKSDRPKNLGMLISLYSGLRIGEICGLKWSDIDFENQLIYVQRTVQRLYFTDKKSRTIVTSPKTQKSKRKVPISKTIISKLKSSSKLYPKDSYILTGKTDKYTEPLVYRYTYRQILKTCKVGYKKFHCLRHTFATRCIRVGMDIKSLSEVLGHANIGITLSIYVHSSYEIKKKFIDKL